jgi:hypothetical protein
LETQKLETSRVNLAALAVALIAGLVILRDSQTLLGSLAGLALLITLFSFGQDGARTGIESLAFALVGGLAALCACSFALKIVVGPYKAFYEQDIIPPAFWLLATAVFWFIDRSRANAGAPQPVRFSGYAQPQAPVAVAVPTPETRPFTSTPVISTPQPAPSSVQAEEPITFTANQAPPPQAPLIDSTPVAPAALVPPPLKGKEASIYVNMVGEGMNVLRAVRAEYLGRDFYIIVEEMPADENWEFVPGQVVRCKKKNLSSGKGMVAYEEAPRAQ